jgi:Rrf2 family protein
MQNLLNFSDAVNLAFHSMAVLASNKDGYLRTNEIARGLDVSEHHLQKVHQRLAKVGLLKAIRGPKGGFCLNKPADEITLLDVYEAIEGPLHPNQCLLGRPKCEIHSCVLGQMVDQVNDLVEKHLTSITINNLMQTRFTQTEKDL